MDAADHRALIRETFARTRLFAAWPAAAIDRLCAVATVKTYANAQPISMAGDPAIGIWLVASGCIESSRTWRSGKKIVFDFLMPGQLSGIMPVCDGQPSIFDLAARGETKIVFLPRAAFLTVIREAPALQFDIIEMLSRRNRLDYERIQLEAMNTMRAKVAKFIMYLGRGHQQAQSIEVPVPISQDDVAAMIGASRAATNKYIAEFIRKGILARRYRAIHILDVQKLIRIAAEDEPLSVDARTALFDRSTDLHRATD